MEPKRVQLPYMTWFNRLSRCHIVLSVLSPHTMTFRSIIIPLYTLISRLSYLPFRKSCSSFRLGIHQRLQNPHGRSIVYRGGHFATCRSSAIIHCEADSLTTGHGVCRQFIVYRGSSLIASIYRVSSIAGWRIHVLETIRKQGTGEDVET